MSLNPPLPDPPRTPVRVRKKIIADKRRQLERIKKERKKKGLAEDVREVPSMDRLVRSYLRRHEDKLRGGLSPSQSRREEEYYSSLLLGQNSNAEMEKVAAAKMRFLNPSSLQTAMGRKSMLLENAYAFALRQQQEMMNSFDGHEGSKVMTEQESVEKVERLLREEARSNRQKGHQTAEEIGAWREGLADGGKGGDGEKKELRYDDDVDDKASIPSILHDRPRAIRALSIWSARLASIPYSRWTIGASTALDHWIAREVLRMDEETWQLVLEGGGTDAYVEGMDVLPGGESRRGLLDRMRDIVLVRGALFPETLGGSPSSSDGELAGDLDEDLSLDSGKKESSATEKSIDELLASLGELDDDDDDDFSMFGDDKEDEKDEEEKSLDDSDEQMASLMDELQVWRGRNVSSPYEA